MTADDSSTPLDESRASAEQAAQRDAPQTNATQTDATRPRAEWAPTDADVVLGWIDPNDVPAAGAPGALPVHGYTTVAGTPLVPARRKRRLGWIWPIVAIVLLAIAYVITFSIWPLTHVTPAVTRVEVSAEQAATFDIAWPDEGGAAFTVEGAPSVLTSNDQERPMASLTKVVTALMIIERTGLEPGEPGASYSFTQADSDEYLQYRIDNESSLDVPVGGTLTLHEMLEGIMIGSANNYVDRLVEELWGSEAAFREDAAQWLSDHGLAEIRIDAASGMSQNNVATPRALARLGQIAIENPVLADIVNLRSITLPGEGYVENSNPLLDDPDVIGIKTGSLWNDDGSWWSLMTAKEVTVGGQEMIIYGVSLATGGASERASSSELVLEEAESALQPTVAVTEGNIAGHVSTRWGSEADIVVADSIALIPWSRTPATVTTELSDPGIDLIGAAAGTEIGLVEATGTFDGGSAVTVLTHEITPPTIEWRLMNPLALLGLA